MKHTTWEKDTTPYIVFACTKCYRYLYVKTTQKTKKCLLCRRTHQVSLILNKGEIVHGITEAMNRVKELQNTLGTSQFSAETEFSICSEVEVKKDISKTVDEYNPLFLDLLKSLSSKYREFPLYMIEIIAQEYQIPLSELKILIMKAKKEQLLIPTKEKSYYKCNLEIKNNKRYYKLNK